MVYFSEQGLRILAALKESECELGTGTVDPVLFKNEGLLPFDICSAVTPSSEEIIEIEVADALNAIEYSMGRYTALRHTFSENFSDSVLENTKTNPLIGAYRETASFRGVLMEVVLSSPLAVITELKIEIDRSPWNEAIEDSWRVASWELADQLIGSGEELIDKAHKFAETVRRLADIECSSKPQWLSNADSLSGTLTELERFLVKDRSAIGAGLR